MSKLCKDCVFFYRERKWFGRHKDMCIHPRSMDHGDKFTVTGDPDDRHACTAEYMRGTHFNCGALGVLFKSRDTVDLNLPKSKKPKRPGRIY